jgi:hypothetical protein
MCHQCNKSQGSCCSEERHNLEHRVEILEEQIDLLTSLLEDWVEEEEQAGQNQEWNLEKKCPCSCTDCICH